MGDGDGDDGGEGGGGGGGKSRHGRNSTQRQRANIPTNSILSPFLIKTACFPRSQEAVMCSRAMKVAPPPPVLPFFHSKVDRVGPVKLLDTLVLLLPHVRTVVVTLQKASFCLSSFLPLSLMCCGKREKKTSSTRG